MKIALQTYLTFFIVLLFAAAGNAQTTTSVSDGLWNDSGTWDNGVPVAGGDVFVDHNVTLSGTPGVANTVSIGYGINGATLTIDGSLVVSGSGGSFSNWDLLGSGNTGNVVVNGTLEFGDNTNSVGGIVLPSQIDIFGTFILNANPNGANILSADYENGSTCEINGLVDRNTISNPISGLNQTFWNFVWDCPGQTGTAIVNLTNLSDVDGDLTFEDSGSDLMFMNFATSTTLFVDGIFTINNAALNFNLNGTDTDVTVGGDFVFNSTSSTTTNLGNGSTLDLIVGGNLTVSDGTLDLATGNGQTTNIDVSGNVTHSGGGEIAVSDATANATINFAAGTGSQTFVNNTAASSITAEVNFTVKGSSTLILGPSDFLSGSGVFTMEPTSALEIRALSGMNSTTGNIRTTGTPSYALGSLITYNNTGADQFLGDNFPVDAEVNLVLDNGDGTGPPENGSVTNDVFVGAGEVVLGTITLASGQFNIGAAKHLIIEGDVINSGGVLNGDFAGGKGTSSLTLRGSGTTTGAFLFNQSNGNHLFDLSVERAATTLFGNDVIVDGASDAGVLNLVGDLDITGTTFTLYGTKTGSGSFASTSATGTNLVFEGTGDVGAQITFDGTTQLNNLTVTRVDFDMIGTDDGLVTFGAGAVVNGTLYLEEGETNLASSITLADGATINKGAGTWGGIANPTFPTAPDTYNVIYSAANTTDKEIINEFATGYQTVINNVTVGGVLTVNKNFYINGNLNSTSTMNANVGTTISLNGTNVLSGSNLNFDNLTIRGGADVTGSANEMRISGAWSNLGGTYDPNGGIVRFDKSGDQDINANGEPFNTVIFDGSGSKNLGGLLDASGSLQIVSTVVLNANNFNILVGNTWQNAGTFTAGTGTVIFDGAAQDIDPQGNPFNNLTLSGSSSTKTLLSALTITGNLDIEAGITFLNTGSTTISIDGTWNNDGAFTSNTGTVTFTGVDPSPTIQGAASTQFNNIVFTGDIEATSDFEVKGIWTSTAADFTGTSQEVTFSGSGAINTNSTSSFSSLDVTGTRTTASDISLTGDFSITGGTLTSTGSIIFAGTGTQNVTGTSSFNNITLEGTTNVIFAPGILTIDGNWLSEPGATFTSTGGVEFAGTSKTVTTGVGNSFGDVIVSGSPIFQDDITVSGNWDSSAGTLGFLNSGIKVIFDDPVAEALTITPSTSPFNRIVIDGSASYTLMNSNLNVERSFENNGTLDVNDEKVTFSSGNSSSILGTSVTQFHHIDVTGSGGVVISTPQELTGTLDVIGSSFNTGSTDKLAPKFTLVSTAAKPTADARIADLTGSTFTGVVNVQRFIGNEAGPGANGIYRHMATPVENFTIGDWQNTFPITGKFDESDGGNPPNDTESVFYYDEPNDQWVGYPTNADGGDTAPVNIGQGYAVFIFDYLGDITVDQTGDINTGDVSPTLTDAGSGADAGWNLVGNPKPSAIDWDVIYNDASQSGVSAIIATRDNSSGIYDYYDEGSGLGTVNATKDIAIGQGFWVEVTGGSPNITIGEAEKSTTSGNFFKKSPPVDYVRITLSDGSVADVAIVNFYDDASNTERDRYDGRKLRNDIFNLSTLNETETDMVFNAFQSTQCVQSVKMNMYYEGDDPNDPGNITDKMVPGGYSLSFTEVASFTDPVVITLHDKFLGTTEPIDEGTNYSFNITTDEASFGKDRFELTFDFGQFPLDVNVTSDESVCTGSDAVVILDNTTTGITYTLKDTDGTVIGDPTIGNGSQVTISVSATELSDGENILDVFAEKATCGEMQVPSNVTINKENLSVIPEVQSTIACPNTAVTLTATGAPNGGSYQWYDKDNVAIDGAIDPVYVTGDLAESTDYFVTAKTSAGCEGEPALVTAQVSSTALTVEATSGSNCGAGTMLLTASGSPEGLYQWFDAAGDAIDGATSAEFTTPELSVTTSYMVQSLTSLGCSSALVETIATISTPPVTPVIEVDGNLLTVSNGPFQEYQWYKDEVAIEGEKGSSLLVVRDDEASYTVEVGASGCTTTSDANVITSLDEGDFEIIQVYPNPVVDRISVTFDASKADKLNVFVLDMSGKITYKDELKRTVSGYKFELNVQEYRNGVYFVKMSDGEKVYTGKFVKE